MYGLVIRAFGAQGSTLAFSLVFPHILQYTVSNPLSTPSCGLIYQASTAAPQKSETTQSTTLIILPANSGRTTHKL